MNAFITLENEIRTALPELPLERDVPMSAYTTLRLGGPADLMAQPGTVEEMTVLLALAKHGGCPVTVLGHGSNLLVLDGGIRGLVIRMGKRFADIDVSGNEIRAGGGAMLSVISMTAARNNLDGLAFASGIPGTAGGAAMMNAGAYGGSMSDIIFLVEGIDTDGRSFRYTGDEMNFGYRTSRLRPGTDIVTRITLRLSEGIREKIESEMRELNCRRAEKQPLNEASAGSTFKRPEGCFAAALIEQCGLKGLALGGAAVSEKHAGFLVNRGGTAADFLNLIRLVQDKVFEKTGVRLEPEVRIIGENRIPGRDEHT